MATETVASDHASATDEQIVNKEKSEAIADMITSLANEDEVKHDKPEDANGGHTTPSSKTEGDETNWELGAVEVQKSDDSPALDASDEVKHDKPEDVNGGHTTPSSKTEGDETNKELGSVEVQKSDDSPVLEASAEGNLKHDKIEDAQTPAALLSKTEEDDTKPEPVVVEKTDDPVSLDAHIEDNLKEDKKVIPDLHATDDASKSQPEEPPSTEPTAEETPQQLEKEPVEIEEEKQPDIVDIPEASAETIEKSTNTVAAIPQIESEAEVVKEAEILETSDQKEEEPEPVVVATEVQEKTQEPKNEPQEKPQEAEQPTTVTIPELSTEAITLEEKPRELFAETLKETNDSEAVPTKTVKTEPVVTEIEENQEEPKNRPLEQQEEEQSNTVAIAEVTSTKTSEAVEEKTSELEVLKETNNYEEEPAEAEKAEPEITKVDENSTEPEKESFKQEEEELPKTVITEIAAVGDIVEVHRPKEADIEVVKEIDNSEAEAVPREVEKPSDVVVVHQPIESDIEAVKETDTSQLEVVHAKEEKTEPVSTEVEEKPRELVEVAEDVGETSKEMETKQEIVLETTKIEETSDETIKDPIPLKEDKTDKEEETSITTNTKQDSINEDAQAAPENLVEPSLEVAEKVVEEDGKKEPSFTDVTEGVSKDEAAVSEVPEQAFVDQEAKTDLKEEKEYYVPTSVEEKVAAAENYDKKEPEAPESAQVSSREAEFEINKDEKHIEAKTPTTEDDGPAVKNEKGGHTDTKVDEISSAVSEPVRETLASKFEEEETTKTGVDNLKREQSEEPSKESDATKTSSKDLPIETPAKPAQKQSNNIISKVKQSLVKAKKAIIGKSPSSKNHSTEAKDDIQVK